VNVIEDRLRDELRAVARLAQPDTIRPLRRPQPRRQSTTARWLAPVLAMAAVVAVAAGVVVARQVTGPPAAPAGTGGPPFYVVVSYRYLYPGGGSGPSFARAYALEAIAAVRDARTGAALTSVRLWENRKTKGPGGGFPLGGAAITTASNNRTFAVVDENGLFTLHVAVDGRSARLVRMPISLGDGAIAAISPDGTRVAIEDTYCKHGTCDTRLRILSVATGAGTTWTAPMNGPSTLAWTARGRQVMFRWGDGGWFRSTEYRLLAADAPAGDLLARSTPMPYPRLPNPKAAQPSSFVAQATPAPDGRTLIVVLVHTRKLAGNGELLDYRIAEMSPATGRILAVLYRKDNVHFSFTTPAAKLRFTGCNVLSLPGSGAHALIQCQQFGRLDGARFTPLPAGAQLILPQLGLSATW
jgi:hypothetical protein